MSELINAYELLFYERELNRHPLILGLLTQRTDIEDRPWENEREG